jgi:hypothetical protein
MLHLGLDLSRRRLDVCALDERGEELAVTAAPPDTDGLGELVSPTGLKKARRTETPSARLTDARCGGHLQAPRSVDRGLREGARGRRQDRSVPKKPWSKGCYG